MKRIKSLLIVGALFLCTTVSLAETSKQTDSVRLAAKQEVQMYIDAVKPLVEAVTGSNKIGGLPENIVYGILSLIAVSVIMFFHRKSLAKQNDEHAATLKTQSDAHAKVIEGIINKPS